MSSEVNAIKAEVASLPDSDRAAFTAALSTIGSRFDTIVQAGRTTLNDIEQLDPQGELKSAIEDDPTCQSLKEG